MNRIYKAILWCLLLTTIHTQAQTYFDNDKSFNLFKNYTNWGIQLEGLMYFPASIDNTTRNLSFQTQVALGYKAGLVYNFNIVNHFGIHIGALLGQAPAINTYFQLPKERSGLSDDYYHKKSAIYSPLNFSFPILFEYRNFSIYRYTLSLGAGMQIQRTTATNLTESYDNFYLTQVQNPGTWNFDLLFKAGWYYQFPKIMMQTSIVYKYRLQDQYTGNYTFTNLQNPAATYTGSYIQKGNYIGLSFDFYFRNNSREVDMGCRANTQSKQVHKRQKAKERLQKKLEKKKKKALKKKEKRMKKMARRNKLPRK